VRWPQAWLRSASQAPKTIRSMTKRFWPAEVQVFRLAPYWHAKPPPVRPKSPSSRFLKPLDRLVSSKSDSPNSTSTPEARFRNAADAEPVDREQPPSFPLALADSLHDACHRGDVGDVEIGAAEYDTRRVLHRQADRAGEIEGPAIGTPARAVRADDAAVKRCDSRVIPSRKTPHRGSRSS
jgi:hypothetical protein